MKKSLTIINLVLLVAVIGYLVYTDSVHPKPEITKEVIVNYGVPDLMIPDTVYFAGERVPLEIPDVKERLDRELHVNTFWHSNTIFLLKRGKRWLPDLRAELEKEGIHPDMVYLAVIESDLQNKVSPSQAVGFWQLLKGTATDFRLEVNSDVDERYHPIKSAGAAANYLSKAHDKFGSWTDAAASYNIGRRGLELGFTKQGVDSYYDLLLGEETARYVFRAIAIKMIFENPTKYGFNISEENLYHKEQLKEVEIDKSIENLRDWAFEHDINYKQLKRYNPWLRTNRLIVSGRKTYTFLIPRGKEAKAVMSDTTTMVIAGDTLEPDIRDLPEALDGL